MGITCRCQANPYATEKRNISVSTATSGVSANCSTATVKGTQIVETVELLLLILTGLLLAIAILLLVPGLVLFIECIAALFPRQSYKAKLSIPRPQIAVLVPAHNEEDIIESTLMALLPELSPQDQLVVIADNCSDHTADSARGLGVTVIERQDAVRRGKGYALDFGVNFLADHPPDVVVIMDADCVAEPGAITKISEMAAFYHRPVQATYILKQPPVPTPKDAISMLAFRVKNLVRPVGLNCLGMPCPLTGTGMAFPWSIIKTASLASGNIVEDMNLGLDLAIAGYPPMFCRSAEVTSILPQQERAAKSQRTRWEQGHLETIVTQGPRLLAMAVRKGRSDLLMLALDLLIPPLSLLVMLWLAGMVLTLAATVFGGISPLPAMLLGLTGILLLVAVLASWAKYSRSVVPAKMLLAIPLYLLWKIPLYFKFLTKPEKSWVRTERDVTHDNSC